MDPSAEYVRQRGEIVVDPFAPGGISVFRLGPAGGCQQSCGRGVDQFRPRGKRPYVRPLLDRGGRAVARLQNQRLQTLLQQVGCGGQAQGAGTNDDDGQVRHQRLLISISFDASTMIDTSIDVNMCHDGPMSSAAKIVTAEDLTSCCSPLTGGDRPRSRRAVGRCLQGVG